MEKTISLSSSEYKDLQSYCKLNNLKDDDIIKNCYLQGFRIERYGLLTEGAQVVEKEVEKIVEKRVEIPVEVIKEVIKIEYVEVIKEVEKIVEVPVEVVKEVEKIIYNQGEVVEIIKEVEKIVEVIVEKEQDNTKLKALESTLQKLKMDNIEKDKKIKELEKTIENIQLSQTGRQAVYLKGSNLDDKLYK
jgi:hypothetical protein